MHMNETRYLVTLKLLNSYKIYQNRQVPKTLSDRKILSFIVGLYRCRSIMFENFQMNKAAWNEALSRKCTICMSLTVATTHHTSNSDY